MKDTIRTKLPLENANNYEIDDKTIFKVIFDKKPDTTKLNLIVYFNHSKYQNSNRIIDLLNNKASNNRLYYDRMTDELRYVWLKATSKEYKYDCNTEKWGYFYSPVCLYKIRYLIRNPLIMSRLKDFLIEEIRYIKEVYEEADNSFCDLNIKEVFQLK